MLTGTMENVESHVETKRSNSSHSLQNQRNLKSIGFSHRSFALIARAIFLHATSAALAITVSMARVIGIIRLEYNNGWIHNDKSISQKSVPTLATNVKYVANSRTGNTLACYK